MTGDIRVDWYVEICCEICNDVIHNHFDCPGCKLEDIGTSIYADAREMKPDETFTCEHCGAEFQMIEFSYSEATIRRIDNDSVVPKSNS